MKRYIALVFVLLGMCCLAVPVSADNILFTYLTPSDNAVISNGYNYSYYNIMGLVNTSLKDTCIIDFNGTNYTLGWTWTGYTYNWACIYYIPHNISDGAYNYSFWANDTTGSTNISVIQTLYIDNVYPQIQINEFPANGTYQKGNLTFNLTMIDANPYYVAIVDSISGYLSINGSAYYPPYIFGATALYFTWDTYTIPDGSYIIYGQVADIAGNINHTANYTYTIDNTLPAINMTHLDQESHGAHAISVSDTNIDTCQYWVTGANTITNTTFPCAWPDIPLDLTGVGVNTLYVWANDSAGNAYSASDTFTRLGQTGGTPSGSGGSPSPQIVYITSANPVTIHNIDKTYLYIPHLKPLIQDTVAMVAQTTVYSCTSNNPAITCIFTDATVAITTTYANPNMVTATDIVNGTVTVNGQNVAVVYRIVNMDYNIPINTIDVPENGATSWVFKFTDGKATGLTYLFIGLVIGGVVLYMSRGYIKRW
jgi:hypothetical protein